MSCIRIATIRGLKVRRHNNFCSAANTLESVMRGRLVRLITLATVRPPTIFGTSGFHGRIIGMCRSLAPLARASLDRRVIQKRCATKKGGEKCQRRGGVSPSSHARACVTVGLNVDG